MVMAEHLARLQRYLGIFEDTSVFLQSGDQLGVLFGCLLVLDRVDDLPDIALFREIATQAGEQYLTAKGFDPVKFAESRQHILSEQERVDTARARASVASDSIPDRPHHGLTARVREK
jgi:hypothetical protein